MSTRAMVHFHDVDEKGKPDPNPAAIIYRHGDGYPSGLGKVLVEFLKEVKKQCGVDTRFDDPGFLAAKWVVWDSSTTVNSYGEKDKPLKFLSVGVDTQDHGDIEYRYHVNCAGNKLWITCEECSGWGAEMEFSKPKVIHQEKDKTLKLRGK